MSDTLPKSINLSDVPPAFLDTYYYIMRFIRLDQLISPSACGLGGYELISPHKFHTTLIRVHVISNKIPGLQTNSLDGNRHVLIGTLLSMEM